MPSLLLWATTNFIEAPKVTIFNELSLLEDKTLEQLVRQKYDTDKSS